MSSSASKSVLYRPEHNAKGRPHGTESWRSWNAKIKIPTDRAPRVDEKDGVIFLVIIKMSKMARF